MRAPLKATALFAVLVLASFSVVSAQDFYPAVYVNVDEVQGLTPEGLIPDGGGNLVIPIHLTNVGVNRTAISNGFKFTGEFENINGAWNPAYPWDWIMAYPVGCTPPACYPYFDQILAVNYFTATLAQTLVTADAVGVGFAGLTGASGTGLPATFDDVAYTITLTDIADGSNIVMDSSFWKPANYWLWTGVGDDVFWGGPYVFACEGDTIIPPPPCEAPYTTCWPQPSILGAFENDRILEVYVYCQDPSEIDMASVRVNNIPNYLNDGVAVYDADSLRIWTNVFIMRFLGASGFRPIPSTGIQSTYKVTYTNLATGYPVTLIGDFALDVPQVADVTFDGVANLDDIVLLTDYLFSGGAKARLLGEDMDEIMDVDGDGRFDLLDVVAAVQVAGL